MLSERGGHRVGEEIDVAADDQAAAAWVCTADAERLPDAPVAEADAAPVAPDASADADLAAPAAGEGEAAD